MNDFDTVNMNKAQKTVYYLREYGFHYTMRRAMKKLGFKVDEDSEYMTWVRKQQCSTKELELQSKEKFPLWKAAENRRRMRALPKRRLKSSPTVPQR